MIETKPTGFVPSPIPQPYISPNKYHRFKYMGTTARCSCGWKVWQVGKELGERSHFKHVKRIEEEKLRDE